MEMSDILERAKALCQPGESYSLEVRSNTGTEDIVQNLVDRANVLPGMVAECEFWQQRAIEEHAALKKLGKAKRERGKALVEERAWVIFNEEKLGSRQDPPYQDVVGRYEQAAREQLRVEGKL